jgi:hypothetical protein
LSGKRFDTGECDRTANASPCLMSGSWGKLGDRNNITKLYKSVVEKLTFSHRRGDGTEVTVDLEVALIFKHVLRSFCTKISYLSPMT